MIRKTIGKSVSMIVCWRFGIIQKDLIRKKEISKLFCVPLQNTKRLIFFERDVYKRQTEEEVSTAVTGFSANFQFQDETYYLSEDTQFYQDGVMFCVYDDNGKLLYGTMPEKFPKQTILKSHTPRVITSGSSKWMVYDPVSYTHLDVYKRQIIYTVRAG